MIRNLSAALLVLAASFAARPAMAAEQVLFSQQPSSLSAGATAQVQLSVQLDTIPFGGYLFTLNYDTRTLTLLSLTQASGGEFQDEFYQGPGAAAGSFTFQGLNDKSLLSPTGSANLATAVFQATSSSAPFAGSGIIASTVTVTAREGVSTAGSTVAVFGGSVAFQILGDTVPPTTSLSVSSGPQFLDGSGQLYVAGTSLLGFVVTDAAFGSFPPSGVAETDYRVDASTPTAPFQVFSAPFSLSEGSHLIEFRSVDRAGNVESVKSRLVKVDATIPATQVAYSSAPFIGVSSRTFVAGGTSIGFAAQDPVSNGVASGVGSTQFRVDAATTTAFFQLYASTFSLPGGTHTIDYRSIDNVANVENSHSISVTVDTAPPATNLIVDGLTTGSTSLVLASTDVFSFAAFDAGSGVQQILFAVDGGTQQVYASTFTLSVGTHTLVFDGLDNVGNLEAAHSVAVSVKPSDLLPPRTSLQVGTPSFSSSTLYAASVTTFSLAAVDDKLSVGDGAGVGVARTYIAVDTTTFSLYGGTFAFAAPGAHVIRYYSVDLLGNVEVARSSQVVIDGLPPRTAVAFSTPSYLASRLFLGFGAAASFSAVDDLAAVGDGLGSGTAQILVSVDSGSFAAVLGPVLFSTEGVHSLSWFSRDHVGNFEATRSTTAAVDLTAPFTQLVASGPVVQNGSSTVVGLQTLLSLSAIDPTSGGVASGVKDSYVAVATTAFALYSGTFTLTGADGLKPVQFYSRDNVLNTEAIKTSTVALDATPPSTTLLITGGRQFAGSSASTFYASPDTRLVFVATDPVVGGVASGVAFTRWQDNGGAFQLYTSSLAFAEGAHALGYQSQDNVQNLEILRSTTALVDATPPVTTVSIASPTFSALDGTIYVATTTPVAFIAADPALTSSTVAGSGVNHIEVAVDSAAFAVYASSLTFAEGRHTVLYRAVDNVGNVEAAHALTLRADGTPPATALVIGSPQFQLSSATVLVSSLTPVALAAVDPIVNGVASGVQATLFQLSDVTPSTAPFAVYAASFTLTPVDVLKIIQFFSRDNVLNTEIVRSSSVLMDSTPPEAAILSPHGSSGICSVVKGKVPVLGTARDLHLASYVLEAAPGQNASAGFVRVSSGAVAVSSGVLGNWDASALSGWQTLRLTATDLVQNVTVAAINVYVGDPGELLLLGNHDVFDMPRGVAADAAGNIYVADTNADRIAVFTSTGAPVAAFGQAHDDHGDDSLSTSSVRLNKPASVAVDAANSLFIADTNNDRVLKLSATGQLLLSVGRRPGKALGEFNKPSGVAVDAAGNIYVADTDNDRIQVLSSTGTPLRAFALPPVPRTRHDDEDDGGDAQTLGRPSAVAVDAAGNVYVADARGGRALKFGATGQLLLTLPITGQTKDGHVVPGQPDGIAVSPSGDCLLVSDRKFGHVFKFDALGDQTLVFGAQGKLGGDKSSSAGIVFNKPAGLALAPDGTLLVADRNNDRVERFGLPTGTPPLVTPAAKDDPDVARDVLDKNDGGVVTRGDNAGVAIPPGALASDLKISVSTMSPESLAAADLMNQVSGGKGLKPAYAPVEYGPEGTKFSVPVTIVVPYDPRMVAAAGLSEDGLQVQYWNRDKSDWEALASTVDKAAHTVTAKTPHFSLYQVLGSTGTGAFAPLAIADPTFTFHDAYAFPNPVRGTNVATIRIQVGVADSVEVHVYDVTGRRVHSSSDFRQSILDDGNGKGSQYTDDHFWDISGVGSGVYTFVITAKKSGMADIHKSGRVGIIK